ncbi:MAG: alpha/beta hydrolase family protein [Promethearchaeota archaeon]
MPLGIKKISRRSLILITPIILLGTFSSLLIVNRSQGYLYYERIEFDYNHTKFHANLYYPTKKIDFQDKHPLIIYIHGFSGQKDRDSRIPLELTKRGFYVVCVDMPGHGESANSDLLAIDEDGEFVATQICSKLLDKIEKLDMYSQIDEGQIALLGFSYGGYVALMNGLYDDRFTVIVTWAGVADVTPPYKGVDISDRKKDLLHENNPVEVMNNGSKQPDNLLLIVHKEDYWYKYNKRLHELTDCKWEVLTYPVSGVSEAHLLLRNTVMVKTIAWFEVKFFDSTSKNGPIELSYQYDYLLIFLTMVAMCFTVFSLMIYFSTYFLKKEGSNHARSPPQKTVRAKTKTSEISAISVRIRHILVPCLIIFLFVGIWILSSLLLGISGYLIASGLIILIYGLFLRKINRGREPMRERKLNLKYRISSYFKSESTKRALGYAIFCSAIFLALYYTFALFYSFYLVYPHSFLALALAMMYIPLYLSTEIFYRKMLYPSLEFIESKKKRTIIITIITVFVQIFLMLLMLSFLSLPILIATYFAFMISSLMNGIIYHKTENLGAVFLNSFIILSIFYGATWSFILNLVLILS